MRVRSLIPLAVASGITAQNVSVTDALNSQGSLSALNALLNSQPAVVKVLKNLNNVTVLAPSNEAIATYLNGSTPDSLTMERIVALLEYHVLNGTYYGSSFTNSTQFIPTALTDQSYSNVTGGQVVAAALNNGTVAFYTGFGDNSNVTTANVNFTGGTVHVVNRVLTIPEDDVSTLIAANLTALAGALNQTKLAQNVSQTSDVTIFAPSNGAFSTVSNLLANLSTDDLASILKYHVVAGNVAYSTRLLNETIKAIDGSDLHISVNNGIFYVNSAKVIEANVLVDNGVIHVIDNVLNPGNSTATPNPTASSAGVAFTGASSASSIPFTSGVAGPTTTAPIATAMATSTGGAAAPMRTGAVGVAALFGGVAVMVNL